MSVNRTVYIIYGMKLNDEQASNLYDKWEEEDYPDWLHIGNAEDGIGYIYDGMSGEYAFVGKKQYEFDEYDDFGHITMDFLSEVEKVRVKARIEEILGYKVDKLDYILVDHYS